MDALFAAGARVRAYDPVACDEARRLYSDEERLTLCERRDDTLDEADGLIVVTEWNEFRSPDFTAIGSMLKSPVVFDGRTLYDTDHLNSLGFTHYAIGRGNSSPLETDG